MPFAFIFRGQLHVVAIDIVEISIGISRGTEEFAFKFNFACWEDVINAMDYAIAICLQGIAEELVLGMCETCQ